MSLNKISQDTVNHAQESPQVIKMRGKLAKILENQDKRITDQAIQDKKLVISEEISKKAADRVILKEKLSLFDSNQNTADVSKKVKELAERLKKDLEDPTFPVHALANKQFLQTSVH